MGKDAEDQDAEPASAASQEGTGADTSGDDQKVFTQSEVNDLIKKRLDRERKKYADMLSIDADPRAAELAEREKAVTVRELKADASTALAAAGLPVKESLELINLTDKEACGRSVEALKAFRDAVTADALKGVLKGGEPLKKAPAASNDPIRAAFTQ